MKNNTARLLGLVIMLICFGALSAGAEAVDRAEAVPDYSDVNNWAYFSQGCGLHDATWQKSFGLERWQAGYGSHGCINLPLSIANQMRSKTSVGDIIIIHK